IEAFARILLARPECVLTFVGPDTGLLDDGGRRWHRGEFINHVLPDPALRCRVQCLGPRSHAEIAELRKQSMVTVVCSRFENFPNVVLEAMAKGCPLVASEVGGVPEMIRHGHNGLLCRPADPADLGDRILMLLNDPDLAERLGQQAAKDCEERYHPDAIAEKTVAFYRRVIERFRAGNGRRSGSVEDA
ncbi:MAG TPA: glycosyltransferase family 4 protein, partial [Phycisphaerae bacterium]|nr:glycosyltransferase family 4 protein [Phycisphaerae bacterium]